MKKSFLIFTIITIGMYYPSMLSARNYSFSITDSITGQTVYYKINSNQTSVSVVYPGDQYDHWNDNISGLIVHYQKPIGTLIIPDYVSYNNTTYPVSAIEDNTFRGCDSLTDVSIGNKVSKIGSSAFYGCSNLHSVTLGSGVTSPYYVGREAFLGCDSLIAPVHNSYVLLRMPTTYQGKYTLPDVKYVCNHAFDQCYGIDTIIIPNGIMGIQSYAFSNCACRVVYLNAVNCGVSSVYVYGTGDVYGGYFYLTPLEEVIVGDSVHIISELFRGCGQLQKLTLGKDITEIKKQAFANCSSLADIYCKCVQAPQITYFSTGTEQRYNTFYNVHYSTCSLHIPCDGSGYNNDNGWNFRTIERNVIYEVSAQSSDTTRGYVTIVEDSYCFGNTSKVKIQAIPHNGFHFSRWSNGNTDNPITLTLTHDTTIYAIFEEGTVGIFCNQFHDIYSIYTRSGRIIIDGVKQELIRVFDMYGRYIGDGSESHHAGVYLVKIGDHPAQKIVVVR